MGRLRLRFNAANRGASGTRNTLMDDSLAAWLVFFDDDVMPLPGCLQAYVQAMQAHPEVCVLGFLGFYKLQVLEKPTSTPKPLVHRLCPRQWPGGGS